MNSEQAISLYLELTDDVHAYWAALGGLIVLIVGWIISRKRLLSSGQRVALTIGWFAAAGYLASSLMNRYQLLAALSKDVAGWNPDIGILVIIAEFSPIYGHFETIVWTSFGIVSLGAMLLIWTNVAIRSAPSPDDT